MRLEDSLSCYKFLHTGHRVRIFLSQTRQTFPRHCQSSSRPTTPQLASHASSQTPSRDLFQPRPAFEKHSSYQDRTIFNMVKWEDVQDDLLEAVVAVTPPLSKEQQEQIVGIMTARGHNLTWNAIRYDFLLPPKALHSLLSCR